MQLKHRLIAGYISVSILFGLYGWLFGAYNYRGLAYNLGRGITWPVTIFPALGWVIASIAILLFISVITFPDFFAELLAKEKKPE